MDIQSEPNLAIQQSFMHSLSTVTSIAVDLLRTRHENELIDILKRNCITSFTNGDIICLLLEKSSLKVLREININYPEDNKTRLVNFLSKKAYENNLDDAYFEDMSFINGYNTISYGLSICSEEKAALFSFSKPMIDTRDSSSLLSALTPYLYIALNNIQQTISNRKKNHVNLSKREIEILSWIAKGKTNQEIGIILGVSCFTVKNHIANIYPKLGVVNRAQAIEKAIKAGCLD